jgi:hypothetical protein
MKDNWTCRTAVTEPDHTQPMQITREIFDQQRRPRCGTENPERIQVPFWEWMIRGGDESIRDQDEAAVLREGKLKSPYGPYLARDLFKVPLNREEGPIWTFDRMGATRTELSDGRMVCIGGEHEDWYDPDFHIYNDVIVFTPNGQVEIYGYPKQVFPPTDFHTATLVDDQIIIAGCVGYTEDRRPGHTPVFSLNLRTYQISEVKTSGEMPGWISEHEAALNSAAITVCGGKVFSYRGDQQQLVRNVEDYTLDLNSRIWRRITSRNWSQFKICQADNALFASKHDPGFKNILPRNIEYTLVPIEERWRQGRLLIAGIPVYIKLGVSSIEIIVEGDLPLDLCARLTEEIRANAEAAIQRPCVLEQL